MGANNDAAEGATPGGMAKDPLNYEAMMDRALRGVVSAALVEAVTKGLPGRHHFYVTFRTDHPGTELADHLRRTYPEEMTIVLEHQFWDLEVSHEKFRVILKFAGQPHPIVIPFAAVTRFYDPSVRFGLQFEQAGEHGIEANGEAVATPAPAAPAPEEDEAPRGAVVSLDAFRKK